MFIQCSIVFFYLWTVIGFVSNQLLCYHIGNSSHFLKSHILNKSFRQSSDQSSVVTKNQEVLKFLFHQKAIHVWLYDSFGLELSFLGGKGHADAHKLIKHGLCLKTKIDYQIKPTTGVIVVDPNHKA